MTRKQAFMTVIVAAFALAAARPGPGAVLGAAYNGSAPNSLSDSWAD